MSTKVGDTHVDRLAVVYVRQSTTTQVMEHRESTELQYKLKHRAAMLGWLPERVVVIDDDQGQSGKSAEHRTGFQRLLAEVSLNHVGIVLGIEMSRLARSNKDWHHLLELCGIFGTLLADHDGIYNPGDYNDRLLLGLKGTMSEAELHILHNRLELGKRNKAERGELFTHAPRGFVKTASGEITLDPDEQVQATIALCFEKFEAMGSGRAVLRWLLDNNIDLPVRHHKGPHRGQLQWIRASHGAIYNLLHHPMYAGAYCYGRSQVDPAAKVSGRVGNGRVSLPMDSWQVLKKDHLPAYISWDQYLANLRQLASNAFRSSTPGAPRGGTALLSGVATCARCNRRMSVVYCDRRGEGRYVCNAVEPGKRCQSIQAREVDRLVEQQVLQALEPASIELSLATVTELENERRQLDQHWQQRLERAEFDVQRAHRQYEAVEPENRLVARQLETNWEAALRQQQELQEEHARFQQHSNHELSTEECAIIESLASSIPALWHADTTSWEQRKLILRQLLEEVSVDVRNGSDSVDIRIGWSGGFESRHELQRPVLSYDRMQSFDRLRSRLQELRGEGKSASAIADCLNEEGFSTARGKPFRAITVQTLLFRSDMTGDKVQIGAGQLPASDRWTIPQLVKQLSVPTTTLCHWCRRGWLHCSKTRSNRWTIWANAAEVSRLHRLAAHRRPQNRGDYPSNLTTPNPLSEDGLSAS